jgi:hypothetical protein
MSSEKSFTFAEQFNKKSAKLLMEELSDQMKIIHKQFLKAGHELPEHFYVLKEPKTEEGDYELYAAFNEPYRTIKQHLTPDVKLLIGNSVNGEYREVSVEKFNAELDLYFRETTSRHIGLG